MMKVAAFLVLILSGCTTTENSQIEIVRNGSNVRDNCQKMGRAHGDSVWGREFAENDIRNNAKEMDANVIVLSKESNDLGVVNLDGEAYLCEHEEL